MHAIPQLQVAYQRLEDHCNVLWAAMLMTTGLIAEQSVSQRLWTGHWSPVCRAIKPYSPRLFCCQELLGFILSHSIFTTFAAAPECGWQGKQGLSLCSIHGQLGTKAAWRITGNIIGATLSWASCCYCTSCKLEGPPQCAFFPMRRRMEEKGIIQHLKVSISFLLLLYSYSPAALHFPHRCNRAPKFNCWDGNMFNNILWKRHGEKFQYRWRILVPDCALGFQCISSIKVIKMFAFQRRIWTFDTIPSFSLGAKHFLW